MRQITNERSEYLHGIWEISVSIKRTWKLQRQNMTHEEQPCKSAVLFNEVKKRQDTQANTAK